MSDQALPRDDTAPSDESRLDTPGASFPTIVEQFHATILALRELLEAVAPHVAALDENRFEKRIGPTLGGLSPEKRRTIAEFFGALAEDVEQALDDGPPVQEPVAEGATTTQSMPSNGDADAPGSTRAIRRSLDTSEIFDHPRDAHSFVSEMIRSFIRPPSSQILNGSMLAMAVGAFEVLLAGVLTEHYRLHPSALGGDEKEFSLDDLAHYESIVDAREALIARRVDAKMRDSFEEWCRWFEKNLNLRFADLCDDLDELDEAFQRRHLIVHNASRVSRPYNDRAKRAGRPETPVGTTLEVSDEYLSSALDRIGALGLLLGLSAWADWVPASHTPRSVLLDRTFELMVAERWYVAEALCRRSDRFPIGDEYQRLALKANHWLCRKRIRGIDDIREEVASWDTSTLKSVFALVRCALLDEFDAAFGLIPSLVESGELPIDDLRGWPIFEDLRSDPRYSEYADSSPAAELADGESGEAAL